MSEHDSNSRNAQTPQEQAQAQAQEQAQASTAEHAASTPHVAAASQGSSAAHAPQGSSSVAAPQARAAHAEQAQGNASRPAPAQTAHTAQSPHATPHTAPQARAAHATHTAPTSQPRRQQDIPAASDLAALTRRKVLIGGGVLVAAVATSAYAFTHQEVEITVNGTPVKIRSNARVQDVIDKLKISTQPGNLISLTGKLLQEAQGYPYTLILNGEKLDFDDAALWRPVAHQHIEIRDGENKTEPFTSEVTTLAPKLEHRHGNPKRLGCVSYVTQWPHAGKVQTRTGSISGEVVENDVLVPAQNCIVTTKPIVPDNNGKGVGISFDDGPSIYTERYLAILREHNVHATFFNIGRNVDMYPKLSQQLLAEGHHIASHTYTHPPLNRRNKEQVQDELREAAASISKATDVATTMLRPPYGAFNLNVWLATGGLISSEILWTHDTFDWKQPGVDAIVNRALDNITPGSVILMHDGGGKRDQDLEALPRILEGLKAKGLQPMSIHELIASDSSFPREIADGVARMPENCDWPTELA